MRSSGREKKNSRKINEHMRTTHEKIGRMKSRAALDTNERKKNKIFELINRKLFGVRVTMLLGAGSICLYLWDPVPQKN